MTTASAPALKTSPAAPPLEAGRRRAVPGAGEEFLALLGEAGGDAPPVARRQEAPAQERRTPAHPRPEPRPSEGGGRADVREVAERRREEVTAARADRAALRRQATEDGDDARARRREQAQSAVEPGADVTEQDDGRPEPVAAVDEPHDQAVGASPAAADGEERLPEGPAPGAPLAPVVVLTPAQADLAPGDAAPAEAEEAPPGTVVEHTPTSGGVAAGTAASGLPQAPPEVGEAPDEPAAATVVPVSPAGEVAAAVPVETEPSHVTVLDGATPLPGEAAGVPVDAQSHDGAGEGSQQQPTGDQALEPTGPVPASPPADEPVTVTATATAVGSSGRSEAAVGAAGSTGRTSTEAPEGEAPVLRTPLGAAVADLARTAHRDGSGATRVVIRLDPPELGTVTIALTVRGGDVRVSLVAAENAAVQALDSRRADVQAALADAGLVLDGYDVQSGFGRGQEQQQQARERAALAGRSWRALGPEMDFERAAAVDRAARGVWL